jgi:hypothetical protein
MKNADKPINPCMMQQVGDNYYRASKGNDPKEWNIATEGLTKREYFATKAMQAYAGREYTGQSGMSHEMIASWSVEMADTLLSALANER